MTTQIPIALQRDFWNRWNAETREQNLDEISERQARVVLGWLADTGRTDLDILEVGCGAGWLCRDLGRFGRVTGTDLSDEVLERARTRTPQASFLAGDFMDLDLGRERHDVVVTLEVLSHIADQQAFAARLARMLRPGGLLMLATQNRPVLQRYNNIAAPQPGQLRNWVDRAELERLLAPHFHVERLFSVTPRASRGLMRLVNSRTLNRPIRAIAGDRFDRLKERLGLGWTLMALARKRGT